MSKQKLFTCQDISHENDDIQGFCLNLERKSPDLSFDCNVPLIQSNILIVKKTLKDLVRQNLLNLTNLLNKSFASVKTKFEECSKQMKILNTQLIKISESLTQQVYQQIKQNLQMLKELYQYIKNQEKNTKQSQIGTQLNKVKQIINALNQDQYKQQQQFNQYQQFESKNDKQDYENKLQQGIELLRMQKWEKLINSYLK